MPGYLPQTIANNVMTANNAVIMVGDQAVMFAQTSGSQVSYGTEQLYGVGTALPQEVQQLRVSPSFSLDALTLTAAGMRLFGNNTQARIHLGRAVVQYPCRRRGQQDHALYPRQCQGAEREHQRTR